MNSSRWRRILPPLLCGIACVLLGCLSLRLYTLYQDESAARSALAGEAEQLRRDLEERDGELALAQEELEQLKSAAVPVRDGESPDYTQLYPDLYAEPWEGEDVLGEKTVCLTFDDGPSENTDRILKILDRYQVKATFFVVGKTDEANQQRMRDIVAAGHTLGIHSWSHNYGEIYDSVEAYLDDFHQLYQWIYEVTGVKAQVFRFPGGSINGHNRGTYQEIIAEMTRRGFVYFDWNASAQDATARPAPAASITANCLKGVGRSLAVVLAHDSAARTTTVDALPAVIRGYRDAGYTFAPLTPGVRQIIFNYKQPE